MNKPKLIFCINLMPDTVGGIELWSQKLGNYFSKLKYQVVILVTTYSGAENDCLISPLNKLKENGKTQCLNNPLRYEILPPQKNRKLFWEKLIGNQECLIVPNECESIWDDCADLIKLKYKIKIINVVHTDNEYIYDIISRHHYLFRRFITVSTQIADNIQNFLTVKKEIVVLPIGVHSIPINPARSFSKKIEISFVGRLFEPHKGIFLLPEIIKILSTSDYIFNLNIIGSGPDENQLKLMAQHLKVDNQFTFHDQLPHAKVCSILERSHIFIQPSHMEGMSLALLEAMGRGCVPVVTPVSGAKDAITHGFNGFISKTRNAQELANYCLMIAEDKSRFQTMSTNAWDTAIKKFSWESYLQSFESFLHQINADPFPVWPRNLHCTGRKTYSFPRRFAAKVKKTTLSLVKGIF